jgi:hypothetical protein
MFSVGLSPVIATAVREGLSILKNEPWRTARVQDNSRFFLEEARARDLNVGPAVGAGVVSIQFPSYEVCMQAAETLLRAGYYAPPIPIMAVPKNKPRIRFFISALHTQADITGALDVLADALPRNLRHDEAAGAETVGGLPLGSGPRFGIPRFRVTRCVQCRPARRQPLIFSPACSARGDVIVIFCGC